MKEIGAQKTVDFSNAILGRAASRVAKALLNGEKIVIVNAEKAVIRGTKSGVMEKFVRRQGWTAKGNTALRSANMSRMPDRIVKWTVKHMLPTEKSSGRTALDRLEVYMGIPSRFEKNIEKWPEFENKEKKNTWTLRQISHELGWDQKE
ncbi:MAG: 50S ribosomal protein L13 [Candidatus Micrarchaeota archaeon]